MNMLLWGLQLLMAVFFVYVGQFKVFHYEEALRTLAWVPDLPPMVVGFIGLSEMLGGLGLVLPAATRIEPRLTGYAALGLTTVMTLALLFHLSRGEFANMLPPLVLGLVCGFVAYGRMKLVPIEPGTGHHPHMMLPKP